MVESAELAATENGADQAERGQSLRDLRVPTDGMARPMKALFNSQPGRFVYYLTADVRVFLFLSMMAATVLGLLYTIFSVWATRFGSVSAIWAAFSFGLLVTLVAVSILYALYVLVTVTLERR